MSTGKSLLLFCDEPAQQEAALQILRAANPQGQIFVADDHDAAFDRLAREKFDCVFCCSQSGPEAAVNFLTEVWNRTPTVSRFVLAPSIDPETQVRCAFGAHHYLATPLQPRAVQNAIEEAALKYEILPNYRVQLLISHIRHLPSRPSIYFEVLRELHSPNADPAVVAELIQKDIGIASKLLQIVNSVFYGRAEAVHDIEEAVLFLGFDVTASVVLSLEALSRFEKIQPLNSLADEIWAHSQTLAELARKISQSFGQKRSASDKVYLAGLLHDIGKLVLAHNFPEEYRKITSIAEKEKRPLVEVEREILDLTHADAGAYLLAVWGLPLPIVQAVSFHHAPADAVTQNFSPAAALHIAEHVLESDKPLDEIIGSYPQELGLFENTDDFTALFPERPAPAQPAPAEKASPKKQAAD